LARSAPDTKASKLGPLASVSRKRSSEEEAAAAVAGPAEGAALKAHAACRESARARAEVVRLLIFTVRGAGKGEGSHRRERVQP